MISGSLKVEASPSKSSKSASTKVKAEDIDAEITASEVQPNDQGSTSASAEETPLTLGGSTWKREIELLHELEKVPAGESNAKIDLLHAEIMAIVEDSRKKENAIKEAKKAAKAALKANNKAKKEDGSEEMDELAEDGDGSNPEADEEEEEEKPKPKSKKAPAKGRKSAKKEKEDGGCASHDELDD